jgi:hypothetical protein
VARVVLENIEAEQLIMLGDAAFQDGNLALARALYLKGLSAAGGVAGPALYARLGMAAGGNSRSQRTFKALLALQEVERRSLFIGDGLATWMKTPPFTEDARFLDIAAKHAALLPTFNWHWNLQTVAWAVQQVRTLPGDFVELGVFKGHTTLFLAEYLGFETWTQRWFLYDTFEGIPEDQLDPGWSANNAAAYGGTFSYEEVRERFAPFANIQVIQGRVPEILAGTCPEQISFLHMDLNNATAEVQALDALFERIVPGGVIVFDDYCWTVSKRQRTAEDAWMAERGLKILPLPTGQGLFIKH